MFISLLLTRGIYLAIWRRLSLVTEWIFPCRFIGGTPVLLLGRCTHQQAKRKHLVAWFPHLVAFSFFDAVAALLLEWKYEPATF